MCKGSVKRNGRVVQELAAFGIVDDHELVVAPWRILFRVHDKNVFVLAVFDSRRNLDNLLLDRFLR